MQRDGAALLPHQANVFKQGHISFLEKGTAGRKYAHPAPERPEYIQKGFAQLRIGCQVIVQGPMRLDMV